MTNRFLGAGWSFPVQTETGGRIEMAVYEESIRQAVWLILGTAPGERVMRPDFGCGIHDLVFAVSNSTTYGRVEQQVRDALIRWEPRIRVEGVQATADPADPTLLLIRIGYVVRSTNNQFNLVYPFYLERSAP